MDYFDFDALPEEVLEKIFSFTSQYNDYSNISLVCKKWNRIINGLKKFENKCFNECFQNGQIYWNQLNNPLSPTRRHSHSCCRINDKIYIFGGLSNTCTSYNDLWSLDLNSKKWYRHVTEGQYPSPKAAASLVAYKSKLILFGGYSHPYQYPLNQQVNFFDELHVFCIETSTWNLKIFSLNETPKLAGHTASIIDEDKMIIFGGCNGSLANKINNVYCLCLTNYEWVKRDIIGIKPEARYGHSQITIDNERLIIIGGCGGPNNLYDDVWLLKWPKNSNEQTIWQKLIVRDTFNAPIQLHCVSIVKCGEKLITFGRPRIQQTDTDNEKLNIKRKCTCLDGKFEINNNNSTNHNRTHSKSISDSLNTSTTTTTSNTRNNNLKQKSIDTINSILTKSQRNTIKRLEVLDNISFKYKNEKYQNMYTLQYCVMNNCVLHSRLMQVFMLNIESLYKTNFIDDINWLEPIANFKYAPSNTILYSLIAGFNELILFGGMEIDSNLCTLQYSSNSNGDEKIHNRVGNSLYIMKANMRR